MGYEDQPGESEIHAGNEGFNASFRLSGEGSGVLGLARVFLMATKNGLRAREGGFWANLGQEGLKV